MTVPILDLERVFWAGTRQPPDDPLPPDAVGRRYPAFLEEFRDNGVCYGLLAANPHKCGSPEDGSALLVLLPPVLGEVRCMTGQEKTREQLVEELAEMGRRVAELEASEGGRIWGQSAFSH